MIDGLASRQGVDPLNLPLDRWANHVYAHFTENMDTDQKARFDELLDRPVPGYTPSGVWSDEAMAQSFRNAQVELG